MVTYYYYIYSDVKGVVENDYTHISLKCGHCSHIVGVVLAAAARATI